MDDKVNLKASVSQESVMDREGAEVIVHECSIVFRALLRSVKADRDGVSAELKMCETCPPGLEEFVRRFDDDSDGPVQLDLCIPWDGISPDHWEIPEVGCKIYFNPLLVQAVVEYGKTLAGSIPANERQRKVAVFLDELSQNWLEDKPVKEK